MARQALLPHTHTHTHTHTQRSANNSISYLCKACNNKVGFMSTYREQTRVKVCLTAPWSRTTFYTIHGAPRVQ